MSMRDVIEYFIVTNISIVFLVATILMIKWIVKGLISHKVYYFLWLLVMFKILIVFEIPSFVDTDKMVKDIFTISTEAENVQVIKNEFTKEGSNNGNIDINEKVVLEDNTRNQEALYETQHLEDENTIVNESFTYILDDVIDYIYRHEVIIMIYILISFLLILVPISSMIVLRRDYPLNKCEDDTSQIYNSLGRMKLLIGSKKKIKIQYVEDVARPGVLGVLNPIILLPITYKEMPPDKLELILLHEVMHIHKYHLLVQWIGWILKAINWINPLIWLSHRELKNEAELWCDDEVSNLISTETLIDYGNLIIDISVNEIELVYQMNVVGFGNNNAELKERIKNMAINQHTWVWLGVVAISLLIFIFFGKNDIGYREDSQPFFAVVLDGEPIYMEDVITLDPVEARYRNGIMELAFKGEISPTIYELVSGLDFEEYYVTDASGNMIDNYISINGQITFPAAKDEDIRRKRNWNGIYYRQEEGLYITTIDFDERYEREYSYEDFGPCYLSIFDISMEIPIPYEQSIRLENENSTGTIDFGDFGSVRYGTGGK